MPILYIRDELNEQWLPVVSELGAIPNVTFPNGVTDGQVLVYHSGSGVWTAGSSGGTGSGSGGGDMYKSVYDQDNDGIVDNSEKLGGQLPSYYSISGHTHTESQITDLVHDAIKIDGRDINTSDVPSDGQALVWNASTSKWEYTTVQSGSGGGNATQLQGRDIADTAPGDLQYLGWNNSTSKWEPKTITTTAGSDATKIWSRNISSAAPSNNDVLKWNSGASQWEPGAGGTSTSGSPEQRVITFYVQGNLSTGTKQPRYYYPFSSGSIQFTRCSGNVSVAPTGQAVTFQVRRSTLDVCSVSISADQYFGATDTISQPYWTVGYYLDVYVSQVGSVTNGQDLLVSLMGRGLSLPT